MMRKGDTIKLKIDRVAHGGQGVARADGFVVFVRGAVPGDTVNAVLTRKKKDFAEARVLEVIEPSPDRVEAPCPYFGHCGGCQWQHVRYTRQLEFKKALVEEAMARIGGLSGIPVHDPLGSKKIFGYRNKMEFSFSDRPWIIREHPPLTPPIKGGEFLVGTPIKGTECLMDAPIKGSELLVARPKNGDDSSGKRGGNWAGDAELALGLHVPGSFYKVLDIDACLLQEHRGNEILPAVKRFARESGLPPYNLKTHEGFWRFLTLRRSVFYNAWMVNVITSEYRKDVVEPLARFLTSTFHDVKTVVNNITTRRAAIAVGEWESVLEGTGVIEDRIGPYTFQVSANSFFQTNTPGAATLYDMVVEYAELTGSESVLDLYCGTGTIPIFLSPRSMRVVGMEISESAVEDAEKNCRINGIRNCRFVLGDIRARLSSLSSKPDVLIIDPPRAGMHKDVVRKILDLATEKIVYVSCNPATMARDLAEMKDSYEVVEIQPVDLFPHTYHVESVAKMVKRRTVHGTRPTAHGN
jgi:23S rRNA (uracil1939-C5)-methyltransferase